MQVDLNYSLSQISIERHISIYIALSKIKEVLNSYGISLVDGSNFFDIDPDDEALFFEVTYENSDDDEPLFLLMKFWMENGYYKVIPKLVDEDELEEYINDDGDLEIEEMY